jgi:hypothetical protein
MGKKTTQSNYRALLFEEVLILRPRAGNTEQAYTLIAFTVFSDSNGRAHYKAYCKKEKGDTGGWYLFNDEKIIHKRIDFEKMISKENIGNQVTSLYYLKNEEATMKESAEKASEILDPDGDDENDCREEIVAERIAEKEKEPMRTNQPMTSPTMMKESVEKAPEDEYFDACMEETVAEIIAETEEECMRTNQPMTSPNAPTKAPIEPTMNSVTNNGAYISYSAQYNNIHRSHQIAFLEEEGGLMMQETHLSTISTMTTTMTDSGTSNGVYISSPIQHTNIFRSHQLFFTAMYHERLCDNDEDNAHHDHDFANVCEALKSLSNSPMPLNCFVEQMIYPASRFAFVTRQLSKRLGEPFWHFLNLSIEEDVQIAEAYRCICIVEGFCFHIEERLTNEGSDIVVFKFADEMIPVAVKMWKSCLSKDQNVPINSCIRIMCQR